MLFSPSSPTSAPPTITSRRSRARSCGSPRGRRSSMSRTTCRRATSRPAPSCSPRRPRLPGGHRPSRRGRSRSRQRAPHPGRAAGRADRHWAVLPDNGLLTHLLDRGLAGGPVRRAKRHLPVRSRPDLPWTRPLRAGGGLICCGETVGEPSGRRSPTRNGSPWSRRSASPAGSQGGWPMSTATATWSRTSRQTGSLKAAPAVAEAGGPYDLPAGDPLRGDPGRGSRLLPGSLGTLELSLQGESLAERWQVGRGAGVVVTWRI